MNNSSKDKFAEAVSRQHLTCSLKPLPIAYRHVFNSGNRYYIFLFCILQTHSMTSCTLFTISALVQFIISCPILTMKFNFFLPRIQMSVFLSRTSAWHWITMFQKGSSNNDPKLLLIDSHTIIRLTIIRRLYWLLCFQHLKVLCLLFFHSKRRLKIWKILAISSNTLFVEIFKFL